MVSGQQSRSQFSERENLMVRESAGNRRTACLTFARSAAFVGLLCAVPGCGVRPGDMPDLAPVSGVVTLDGAPLVGKDIIYSPAGGRPSMARTDESGAYELWYTVDYKGAIIGPHNVHFGTPRPTDADPDRPWEETLPLQFTAESELTAEVEDTSNRINFELKTEFD